MTKNKNIRSNLVQSGVSTGLSTTLGKAEVREALGQGLLNVAAGTLGGMAANKIADAYRGETLNSVTHKLAHGAIGAVTGTILSKGKASGAVAGAMGSIVAETVAEALSMIF